MFFKKKQPEKIVYIGPRYRTFIKIIPNKPTCLMKFEIISHRFDDGFLILLLTDASVRYINIASIWSFDIIREEISDDETGSDS